MTALHHGIKAGAVGCGQYVLLYPETCALVYKDDSLQVSHRPRGAAGQQHNGAIMVWAGGADTYQYTCKIHRF